MLSFIIRRILMFIPLLLAISVISFVIIQLPPGDFLTTMITQMKMSGIELAKDQAAALAQLYGLDKPIYIQYFIWMRNLLRGDLGRSFQWNRPVNEILA